MPSNQVREGIAFFQTQGRLLQELGERLVAKSDVALMELIKNAYDADASECKVVLKDDILEILDDGHGMTESEFLEKWMNIATPDKLRTKESRKYKRKVTGSKGIGRFAVRFLGLHLQLQTVAEDKKSSEKTILTINFPWETLDNAPRLHEVKIRYTVQKAHPDQPTGTLLKITELRDLEGISFSKNMRTELLSIVDPFSGLESGGFKRHGKSESDPGFKVILPGTGDEEELNLANAILRNYYARLTIEHKKSKIIYLIKHKDGRVLLKQAIDRQTHIEKGIFADIRFCPRRAGMFANKEIDGRTAWGWLREHGGVGIVDHGFRIRPYGFRDDDWLNVGLDSGISRRDWRVKFMKILYPMPPGVSTKPKLNPMLYLPKFSQLVGAVFVESSHSFDSGRPTDLTPSMDREGFVDNEAFRDLSELVRAGLEMLAYADHKEQRRLEQEEAELALKEMRSDFRAALHFIEKIPTLSEGDKEQVVQRFETLSRELEDIQDYHRIATSKMETVALLGVLAGFLTHEMKRLLHDLDSLINEIDKQSLKTESAELLAHIKRTRDEIESQTQFATTFIANIQSPHLKNEPLNVKSQVNRVVERFKHFTEDRHVQIEYDFADDLMTPPLPVTLYGGVLLNLYTNALKAVFGGQGSLAHPRVAIKSWNDPKHHYLEVADTGVGIPENMRERIWDPLFTTTSGGSSNPLGSGMGLGLTLVKKLLSEEGARINLVNPPPGFSTCFRVQFPR